MTSVQGLATGGIWVRPFIWVILTMGTDTSGSVPISRHISVEEFLEQGGTDRPAPWETAGGAGTHHCGELLGEPLTLTRRRGSRAFDQVWCSRGKILKAVFQPSHWSQLSGTAFKVAQHSSSSCSIGGVPEKPVIPLNTLLEKNVFRNQEQPRGCFFSKAAHPGKCCRVSGSPDQTAPLSRTSHPGCTVTAALGPVQGNGRPSALTLE